MYDEDGNGYLSKQEMSQFIKVIFKDQSKSQGVQKIKKQSFDGGMDEVDVRDDFSNDDASKSDL